MRGLDAIADDHPFGRRLSLVVAVLLLGAANPDYVYGFTWSQPRDLTAPVGELSEPRIHFWGDGSALLTWRSLPARARSADALSRRNHIAVQGRDGDVQQRALLRGEIVRPVAVETRRLALLRERQLSRRGDEGPLRRLSVSFGTSRRPPRRTRRVTTYQPIMLEVAGPSDVAVSPRGEVAVAWADHPPHAGRARGVYRARVVTGTASRGFGRASTIAADRRGRADVYTPNVAYSAAGDLFVTYASPRGLEVRVRDHRNRTFSRPHLLGPRRAYVDVAIGTAPDGHVVVLWGTRNVGEGVEDRLTVRASVRRPGAHRFDPPQVLHRGAASTGAPAKNVELAVAAGGATTAAWTAAAPMFSTERSIHSATLEAGDRFGPPHELARGNVVLGDLAHAPDGGAVIVWRAFADAAFSIHAATRPAGAAAFGAPVTLAARQGGASPSEKTDPAIAFNPSTDQPQVIWPAARLTDTGSGVVRDSAVLRSVTGSAR